MSVAAATIKIRQAHKDFLRVYAEIRERWDDDTARAFDERVVEPLEGQLRTACSSLDRIREALVRARGDCS
jgi:hypothetical protein